MDPFLTQPGYVIETTSLESRFLKSVFVFAFCCCFLVVVLRLSLYGDYLYDISYFEYKVLKDVQKLWIHLLSLQKTKILYVNTSIIFALNSFLVVLHILYLNSQCSVSFLLFFLSFLFDLSFLFSLFLLWSIIKYTCSCTPALLLPLGMLSHVYENVLKYSLFN